MTGWTRRPVTGAAIHRIGMFSTLAPSVSKIRLTLEFWRAKPNWMPRNPKLMFQISQNVSAGLDRTAPGETAATVPMIGLGLRGGMSGKSALASRGLQPLDELGDPVILEDIAQQAVHGTLPVGTLRRAGAGDVHGPRLQPEIFQPRHDQGTLRPPQPGEQFAQEGRGVVHAGIELPG